MTLTGNLIYKCRLCGKSFRPVGVPDISRALMESIIKGSNAMPIFSIHTCDGGHIKQLGVADLIGAERDERRQPESDPVRKGICGCRTFDYGGTKICGNCGAIV